MLTTGNITALFETDKHFGILLVTLKHSRFIWRKFTNLRKHKDQKFEKSVMCNFVSNKVLIDIVTMYDYWLTCPTMCHLLRTNPLHIYIAILT